MIDYTNAIEDISRYLFNAQTNIGVREQHLIGSGAVTELESKIKMFYDSKFALCVTNATNALFFVAQSCNLHDCEVITTPLTFPGTISGLLSLNCRFHFTDLDENLNICPISVREILKRNPKVSAIIAVDFAGTPHQMDEIRKIANEFKLIYISDAAQSLGATINSNKASSLSDVWVTSFCPGKTLFTGEGACIMTNSEIIYNNLLLSTQHVYRQKKELGLNIVNEFSFNGRINPLAAILANSIFEQSIKQLKKHQNQCLKIVKHLNNMGLISSFENDFKSTFFHFYIKPLKNIESQEIIENLTNKYSLLKIRIPSVTLLPDLIVKKNVASFEYKKSVVKKISQTLEISTH
ncbi:MAG: DegT/DnrJ/EryC1/StrS family aminotransferase [Bacteroidales bacterium]|nr:DegT/DnrJ/EryC1/StrS family aminotransferase [Bacteroidales bacterium]